MAAVRSCITRSSGLGSGMYEVPLAGLLMAAHSSKRNFLDKVWFYLGHFYGNTLLTKLNGGGYTLSFCV